MAIILRIAKHENHQILIIIIITDSNQQPIRFIVKHILCYPPVGGVQHFDPPQDLVWLVDWLLFSVLVQPATSHQSLTSVRISFTCFDGKINSLVSQLATKLQTGDPTGRFSHEPMQWQLQYITSLLIVVGSWENIHNYYLLIGICW